MIIVSRSRAMYKEVNTKLNQPELENGVLEFWEKKKIFEKLNKESEGKKPFVFYDGPPGMNGLPHIGHVSNRIYKDIILRYKSMMGYRVERKAGWDAHGLPVEGQAEKELGFKTTKTLDDMCRDAWKWQSDNPKGYKE